MDKAYTFDQWPPHNSLLKQIFPFVSVQCKLDALLSRKNAFSFHFAPAANNPHTRYHKRNHIFSCFSACCKFCRWYRERDNNSSSSSSHSVEANAIEGNSRHFKVLVFGYVFGIVIVLVLILYAIRLLFLFELLNL